MKLLEDSLADAQRRVMEGEMRIAHQAAILEKFIRDGDDKAALTTISVLRSLKTSLDQARTQLCIEQSLQGAEGLD